MSDIILFFLFMLFAARTIFFIFGANLERKRNKNIKSSSYTPFVSVVVPARNEENNIENCILSIMKSSYPSNLFELVAVNDRSTDNTELILNKLKKKFPNLKVINVNETTSDSNLKGKPGAIQTGIDNADGEIILMTDADCIVHPKWIETIVGYFSDNDVALVPAFTTLNGKKIFDKIQCIEWIFMHTMATAGIALSQPLGCYGNNMNIRKNVFYELGGYNKIKFSVTEDLALFQATFKNGNKIKYICSEETSVVTLPCLKFSDYIKQRHRWAIGGIGLGWRAVAFVVATVAMWLCLLIAIILGNNFWIIAILAARIFGDFALEYPSFAALNRRKLSIWSLPATLFFMIMELVIPFLLLKKSIIWKDQVFK